MATVHYLKFLMGFKQVEVGEMEFICHRVNFIDINWVERRKHGRIQLGNKFGVGGFREVYWLGGELVDLIEGGSVF